MSLDKNLTNRIFRIAIQAESAVIILINQQASAFGTDVSGQFFALPPKKFTGPIEAMRHPHFHDRANHGWTRMDTDSVLEMALRRCNASNQFAE